NQYGEEVLLEKINEIQTTETSSEATLSQLEQWFNLHVCARISVNLETKKVEQFRIYKNKIVKDFFTETKISEVQSENIKSLFIKIENIISDYYLLSDATSLKKYHLFQSDLRLEVLLVEAPSNQNPLMDYLVKII